MGFAVAFDLGGLVEGFPFGALLNVGLVEPLAVILGANWEHDAVRQVAIVGDGEHVAARAGFVVGQPFPQLARILAALGWIGGERHHLAGPVAIVAVDHHPVHVCAADQRGPFVAD